MNNGVLTEMGDFIRSHSKLLAFGGRSKHALSAPHGVTHLEMRQLSGVLDYNPEEFTFSALAGTRLDDLEKILGKNGQFLPFDPPFIEGGGTLGGTVATGLSGPGSYRYGGIRDFILGIKYLDDNGNFIRTGGKVVKNAAGFDIPKLMVGSLGSLGALVELSFKVFPKPEENRTIIAQINTFKSALDMLIQLSLLQMEIDSLELKPENSSYDLSIRLAGKTSTFTKRIDKLENEIGDIEILDGEIERTYWQNLREFTWLKEGNTLVKVPVTIKNLPDLERFLGENKADRRYSVGANLAWISWSGTLEKLDHYLTRNSLSGLTVLGAPEKSKLGDWKISEFYKRIKKALDPTCKWAEV
jgi:glycolate oxidase FAD binding subunit